MAPQVENALKLEKSNIQSGTTIEIECSTGYEVHDGESVQNVKCYNGVLNKTVSNCVPSESMHFLCVENCLSSLMSVVFSYFFSSGTTDNIDFLRFLSHDVGTNHANRK